ncbi:MAG: hypothetical protein GWN87_27695 [Desulfuromonadales bacterium]|nr:hypothetical protein [Desulfuromonadales bacterium]
MIDWSNAHLEDFTFDVDAEGIQEIGPSQVFPVKVHRTDGTPAFTCTIPVRAEFYRQLKQTADWESALLKILKARVREEILKRKKHHPVPIEDKLQLIGKQISTAD